jgi:hypothetical protein
MCIIINKHRIHNCNPGTTCVKSSAMQSTSCAPFVFPTTDQHIQTERINVSQFQRAPIRIPLNLRYVYIYIYIYIYIHTHRPTLCRAYEKLACMSRRSVMITLCIIAIYICFRFSWSLKTYIGPSRKVAGSIPDVTVFFFNWPNPSSRTMALGLTQPLTEMNIRNLPGGKGRPARKTDLTAICKPTV